MSDNVQPGDEVIDLGCPLSQSMRRFSYGAPPKRRCRVVRVFPSWLEVCAIDDPSERWQCEHWERAAKEGAG